MYKKMFMVSILTMILLFAVSCSKPEKISGKDKKQQALLEKGSKKSDNAKDVEKILPEDGKIVAEINGNPLYEGEVMIMLNNYLKQMNVPANRFETVKKEQYPAILNHIIELKLLKEETKIKGINVSDTLVNNELARFKKRFKKESNFKEYLKKQGLDEDYIKQQISDNMKIRELYQERVSEVKKPVEKEVREYYENNLEKFKTGEQVMARHILIKVEPGDRDEVKKKKKEKIEDILKQARSGDDFAALAMKYSDGPSKKQGGNLGYFGRGRMVKPFEEAAFKLKKGEISGIVETNFGYHIIKVEDRKKGKQKSYNEVKFMIQNQLFNEKKDKFFKDWLETRKKSVKYY